MNTIYHAQGFWNGLLRRPAWHLREYLRNAEYRALHRFAGKLARLSRHTRCKVEYEGIVIELCDGPSFLSAWDEIFVNKIYEVPVRTGEIPVLVDAGANIGLAALFWKRTYGNFHYLGFEPDPTIAACCRRNLASWGVEGRLEELALAKSEGSRNFQPDGADGGHLSDADGGANPGVFVKAGRLSQRLPEQVDLLKIDVEGAEAEVLEDILPCLPRVRNLFVEWHSRSGANGLGRVITHLEEAGFNCHVQVAVGQGQPFMRPEVAGAFFQNLNLYAVRP